MRTTTAIIILILAIAGLSIAGKGANEEGYTLTGEKSYWENQYAQINISKHHMTRNDLKLVDGQLYFVAESNVTWKYPSNTIDAGFQFDKAIQGGIELGSYAYRDKQKCTYNAGSNSTTCQTIQEKYTIWNDITWQLQHYEHNGKHYYIIRNINADQNELFMLRLRFRDTSVSEGESLKYGVVAKLSADTIAEALSTGRYINLDPVIEYPSGTNWWLRYRFEEGSGNSALNDSSQNHALSVINTNSFVTGYGVNNGTYAMRFNATNVNLHNATGFGGVQNVNTWTLDYSICTGTDVGTTAKQVVFSLGGGRFMHGLNPDAAWSGCTAGAGVLCSVHREASPTTWYWMNVTGINANTCYMIRDESNSSGWYIYVNGTLNVSRAGTPTEWDEDFAQRQTIGCNGDGIGSCTAMFGSETYLREHVIDEFAYFPVSLGQPTFYSGGGAPPAGGNNNRSFEVTINSTYNYTGVPTFNITINGTTTKNATNYNCTFSDILNLSNRLVNVTFNNAGWEPITVTNHNVTGQLQINATQILSANVTWNNASLVAGNNVTLTGNTSGNYTRITLRVYNDDDDVNWTTISGFPLNYTINLSDYQDTLLYNATICSDYQCNDTNGLFANNIDAYFTVWIKDNAGYLLESPLFTIPDLGVTDYGTNPYQTMLSNVINKTDERLMNATGQDATFYSADNTTELNITDTQVEHTIYLQANSLTLNFSSATSGRILTQNGSMNFTGTSFVVVMRNISDGRVEVVFNPISGNYTQYYEYVNNGSEIAEDYIRLISNANTWTYIRVTDEGGAPIKDAEIRMNMGFVHNSLVSAIIPYVFAGQRLTDRDGYVVFITDQDREMQLVASAIGYDTQTVIMATSDIESFTKDTAITFKLKRSAFAYDKATIYAPRYYSNATESIQLLVYKKGARQAKFNTDYRLGLGLGNQTLQRDGAYRFYTPPLRDTEDYDRFSGDNISVYIYIDGEYEGEVLIQPEPDYTELLAPSLFDGIPERYVLIAVWTAIIIFAFIAGVAIKSEDAGMHVFMAGTLFAVMISAAFFYVALMAALHYVMRLARRMLET